MKTIDFTVSYFHRETPIGDSILKKRQGVIKLCPNDTHTKLRERISSQLCDLVLLESPSSAEVEIYRVEFELEEQKTDC